MHERRPVGWLAASLARSLAELAYSLACSRAEREAPSRRASECACAPSPIVSLPRARHLNPGRVGNRCRRHPASQPARRPRSFRCPSLSLARFLGEERILISD